MTARRDAGDSQWVTDMDMDNIVHVQSALKMSNNVEDVYLTIEEDALGKFNSSSLVCLYDWCILLFMSQSLHRWANAVMH